MILQAMKGTLAEDSNAAFVFNCHEGKGRTTTAMVIALIILWHFNVSKLMALISIFFYINIIKVIIIITDHS